MINNISELLQTNFLDDLNWHKKYVDNSGDVKKKELKKFTNETLIAIINYFTESILIGEYELNPNIEVELSIIETKTSTIYINLVEQLIENTILLNSTQNFVKGLNVISSLYDNFSKLIFIFKTSPNYDVLFSSTPNNLAILREYKFDKVITDEFNNFYRTLTLYRYDHFFDERIGYFQDLIELEDSINNTKTPFKHVSALQLKISFLKYKWITRQTITSKSINHTSIKSYLIDKELITFHDIPKINTANIQLNDWKSYLECHYSIINLKELYIPKYEKLKFKEPSEYNFYDLHFLIKYHKDINKDYTNLSEVVLEFEKRENQLGLDKTLYFKNLNYALNNQFSLLVENKDANESDVILLKNKINALQKKSSNDNFFVEYKYLDYLVKKLRDLFENREALDTQIPIKKHLKEIRILFTECEKKISWTENHHNLLYQLPYIESLVDYNSESINKIYFASSFLLPLSIEQVNYEFQKLKIDFNNDFNHLEVFSSLNKEFNLIKTLKENVENNDKKSIETITIFTAIISFIVGSVSGYKFIDSFPAAIIFLLVFSTSLFSFVLLIFISTKGVEVLKTHKKYIGFIYITIILSIFTIFYFKNWNEKNLNLVKKNTFKNEIKKQIDSTSNIYENKLSKLQNELDKLKSVNTNKVERDGKKNN